jgi:chaperonin GroEL
MEKNNNNDELLLKGNDARKVLLSGTKKLYDAVSVTLGAMGQNVIIKRGFNQPIVTKDGVTVARDVISNNIKEDGAIEIMRQAAESTNKEAGDGTTTSIVLGYELFKEGAEVLKDKWLSRKVNSLSFKRGLDKAMDAVVNKLKEIKVDDFDVFDVANISANGDTEIAKLIKEAFDMVGKSGIIGIEQSDSIKSYITRDEGLKFDGQGFVSDFFITDPRKGIVTYGDSLLVLIDAELEKMDNIIYYMEAANKLQKPLVVVAHDFGGAVINMFAKAKVEQGFETVLVKAPMYGEKRSAIIKDLGIMTNTTVMSERTGTLVNLGVYGNNPEERIQSARFGSISKIYSSRESTSIYYDIDKDYVNELKDLYEETKDDFVKERIAMLTGGVAVIKVGGNSEVEVNERVDRVEDAVNATRAALIGGIVAGGGIALLHAREVIKELVFSSRDEQIGAKTLYKVLASPSNKILSNAEISVDSSWEYPTWINVKTREVGNLFEQGIIDPVNVTIQALTNAVSVSSTLLTSGAYVIHQR